MNTRSLFGAAGACSLSLWLSACPTTPLNPGTRSTPVNVDLELRLRPSCGFDTADYDTQCLQALLLILHGDSGEKRICQVLDTPPENIQRLVFASTPQINFGGLTNEGTVSYEIVGLHNKNPDLADAGPNALCDDADNFDNWLFFGESQPLNLNTLNNLDAGDVVHEIPIDCRDCEMGCPLLGQPTCPINPISFCVPGTASLSCEKPCQEDSDCFEGALECDGERCDQEGADPTTFCDVCFSDDDCNPSLGTYCVGLPGETMGLCTYRCPQTRCASGARCNRLGNRLQRIGFESDASADGGS